LKNCLENYFDFSKYFLLVQLFFFTFFYFVYFLNFFFHFNLIFFLKFFFGKKNVFKKFKKYLLRSLENLSLNITKIDF